MLTLYFVRHGQSEANVERVISNRGRVHGLTEQGRAQAAEVAAALANAGISRIYSSPLLRAEQTAAILAEAWGAPYEVTDALREYDCGVLEGKSDPLSWDRHREVWERWFNQGDFDFRAEGGESYRDIEARFVPFIRGLIAHYGEQEVSLALVSHGGTLRAALPLVLDNIDLAFAGGQALRNADVVRGELRGDRLLCAAWGDQVLVNPSDAGG
jgi:probable phosphoglycerate mutase